jgi:RNA polymerase sigma factor (sigma-70 family)
MTALPDWDIASDAELVCSAAAGDRRAFAGIYDRYADRLHDFCCGMVHDRDAAADCVQDVFCTAATRLSQLAEPDKLRPWLYAIARNEALRCLRSRRREQVSDELPEKASGDPDLETLAARSELANLVAEASGGLSERDRSVLELAYRHGLDGPELAEALGVSPGTANKMVSRLRDTIEHSLGALLVARRAQHNPDACPQLAEVLEGWDGRFSILMRKRISRHIESCAICKQVRGQLVNPVALLGAVPVFIPAPAWLRDHTLGQIHLTAGSTTGIGTDSTTSGSGSSHDTADATSGPGSLHDTAQVAQGDLGAVATNGSSPVTDISTTAHGADFRTHDDHSATGTQHHDPDDRPHHDEDDRPNRRGRLALLLILLATLIAGAGLDIAWLHQRNVTIAPADLTGTQQTSGRAATTAASPNKPPPPPQLVVETPISSILTTSPNPVWSSTHVPGTTTEAAAPPPQAPPSSGAFTTHPITTPPTTFFAPTPTPSFAPSTHEHPAGSPPGGAHTNGR